MAGRAFPAMIGMDVDAKKIMDVHHQSGWPVLHCREALERAGGDVDAAIRVLREQHRTYLTDEQQTELERTGSWADKLARGDE